jgi:type IV pilus assembly protein PilY1
MHNSTRNIYTYLGVSKDLTSSGNVFNSSNITKEMLANPTTDWDKVVAYIRGADIFDENNDGDTTDNREIITGDVLHSEPAVLRYDGGGGLIFFGANDGLFHAVDDNTGEEAWAYAPPEILHKLKEYVEGESHAYTVDGTPKVWIDDKDGDGYVDSGEKAIVVFGLRKGGRSYTAIDVSDPDKPVYLWRISGENEKSAGYSPTAPDWVESTLGETWSDPAFSKVMDGTAEKDAVFVGGGYKEDNSLGNTLLALNVKTGSLLEKWTLGTTSVAAEPYPVDTTGDYIADKLYIGDAGGDMWRLGYFPDEFPAADHNIQNWKTHKLFDSEGGNTGFFYAPAVTLQQDYDIVFIGSGDRDDPCNESTQDYLYAIKDDHGTDTRKLADLENITTTPLNEGDMDLPEVNGWYYKLALGEKALAKGTIFYKVFYITTFVPGTGDPCVPGGTARLYALGYLTAGAKVDFDDDGANDRSLDIGGGIPSKPVIVVTDEHSKLLISTGTTAADENSPDTSAGIVAVDPVAPKRNFFSLWWREF